jgi:hypothetical protein
MFVAINHPVKTQPEVTATRRITAKTQPEVTATRCVTAKTKPKVTATRRVTAKKQLTVTATRRVKFAPLQDVSAALLEKKSSSLLEESMNDPVAVQIRNKRVQIVEAVVVQWKVKTWAEVQREMRSVLVGMLGESEAMNNDSSGSESVESESAIMGKYFD